MAKHTPQAGLSIGQPFNPFGLFNGIFVPELLAKFKGVSPGAKLAYGRLARYAGQDGNCFPAVATLASEIGVGLRQAQKYLAELERLCLIRRITRFAEKGQTSNSFQFLWHPVFASGVNDSSGEGVNDSSPGGMNDSSPKESHSEESHCEEQRDLDCPATNRKERDSQPGVSVSSSGCRQYPRVREALADYMMSDPGDERIYPSDRHVVDVMDAADGATEEEVLRCLKFLHDERGLKPGTRNGPRHFAWFPTVVGDHFRQKREREEAANPIGFQAWADRNDERLNQAEFDSMTEAF